MTLTTARLDSAAQTLVLASRSGQLPGVVYWGARLSADEDLQSLAAVCELPLGQAMLDKTTTLSLCPETGRAFPGHPGLLGAAADGRAWTSQFELQTLRLSDNRIEIVAADEIARLRLVQSITMHSATDVFELVSSLQNTGDQDYQLEWLSCPVLPASDSAAVMRGFYGRWCHEFCSQDIAWVKGAHVRENRLGRTSHEHVPALLVPGHAAGEHQGEVWGCQLGWSGDHRYIAEELPDGRRQMQFGELLSPAQVVLKSGETYRTPVLYASYSDRGFNGLSWAFHRHCRQVVMQSPHWLKQRPVHYNCWEAIYFDHQLDTLRDIADRAVAAGAELFVLDDGWFVNRRDDFAGLGDWTPDPLKYPDGLAPLISYVRQRGLRFGLWVEPEMVNKDSDLYRAHPDWILDIDGYQQVSGRNQYILDLSRDEVAEHLFTMLSELLRGNKIDYLKWDMNRSANLAADRLGRAAAGVQVSALYGLLSRIRQTFPQVVIESCSSGGGRIDLGILRYSDRVWLSDSNDAHERWQMQRNASYLLPPEIVGSHVGPRTCHTSGRRLSMQFRAAVAASRHMGFELDPRQMTEREGATLNWWCEWHKRNRSILHEGRHYRLECSEPGMLAEMFVTQDGEQFIVLAAQLDMQQHAASRPLRLAGLQQKSNYQVRLLNVEQISAVANRDYSSPLASGEGVSLNGASLMQAGLVLANSLPDTLWALEGVRT